MRSFPGRLFSCFTASARSPFSTRTFLPSTRSRVLLNTTLGRPTIFCAKACSGVCAEWTAPDTAPQEAAHVKLYLDGPRGLQEEARLLQDPGAARRGTSHRGELLLHPEARSVASAL